MPLPCIASSTPPLPLSDYAAVAAHLLHAADKPAADVLLELGINGDVWRASAATWERALDEELARGEHGLLAAFATSFAVARAALALASVPTPIPPPPSAPAPAPVPTLVEGRRDAGAPFDVPNLPILPDTAIVDYSRLSQPPLPFVHTPQPVPPPDTPPPPEPPEPPPSLLIEPDTARFDARWLPPPPEIPPAPAPLAETPIPLARVKRRSLPARWGEWLRRWLGFGRIGR